jgi:anhydro-N-acetylmuramic acid kinase
LADPYFAEAPPKSTGRERFGQTYTDALYARWCAQGIAPADMVATATALTLESIVQAYQHFFPVPATQVYISGGGVHNPHLMTGLTQRLAPAQVLPYDSLGISADAKEALAFAGLAYATWFHLPSNLPAVTGASGPAVLGQIHPGHNYRQLWAQSAPMLC